jgi:large subunit ribosomal protein L4
MAVVKILNQNKSEVGELSLAPEVFEVEVRPEILHLVVRAQQAAKRQGTHSTKTRDEVSGGGKKPWRQKGTGRARAGTNRSPLWRGGGITFGPKPRDYEFKVNRKVRRLAMRMALSSRFLGNSLTVLDKLELAQVKTRDMVQVASTLGLKKALIVLSEPDNTIALSARNIQGLKVLQADQLSVLDVLSYPQLVMSQSAVASIQERLK